MQLSCDEGFTLRGSPKIKCHTNGTWSKTTSFCEGKDLYCLSLLRVKYRPWVTLLCHVCLHCRHRYWPESWTFLSTAKDCGPLSVPLNGSYTGSKTTFPNKVTFRCDEGFILNGSKLRRCRADGSWSGNDTSCEGKKGNGFRLKRNQDGINNQVIDFEPYDYFKYAFRCRQTLTLNDQCA